MCVRASAPQPDDETGPEDDREELRELVELDFDYLEGIGAPDGMPSGLGEATGALGEATGAPNIKGGVELAVKAARPTLEPKLEKFELEWDEVEPVLVEHLQLATDNLATIPEMLDDPERLVGAGGPLASRAEQAAKRAARSKAGPLLQPLLPRFNEKTALDYFMKVVVPKLKEEGLDSKACSAVANERFKLLTVEEREPAVNFYMNAIFPNLKGLDSKACVTEANKRFKLLTVEEREPYDRCKLEWDDVTRVLEGLDMEQLRGAVEDPENALQMLMDAGGPIAKQAALDNAEPLLGPKLERFGLTWVDVKPVLEKLDFEQLQGVLADPEAFFWQITSGGDGEQLALKIAISRAGATLKPRLASLSSARFF